MLIVPVLGKRKDTDPCRSQFDDTCRRSQFAAIAEKEEEEEELEEELEEVEEPRIETTCPICKKVGHWPVGCPWKYNYPFGPLPQDLPDNLWVSCKRCGKAEFNESYYCIYCGCGRKKVLLKKCWMCYEYGHLNNEDPRCLLLGKEFTIETDPHRRFYMSDEHV